MGDHAPDLLGIDFSGMLRWARDPVLVLRATETVACNDEAVLFFGAECATDLIGLPFDILADEIQAGDRLAADAFGVELALARQLGSHRFPWCFQTAAEASRCAEVTLTVLDPARDVLFCAIRSDRAGARGDVAEHGATRDVSPPAPLDCLSDPAGLRVLVVEDNPTNFAVASMLLRKFGCEVEGAADGEQALACLATASFDIVFMDCMMPVMDGYEATAAIRAGHEGVRDPAIPIIALTANALPGDREKCLAAGMDDYMAKPVKKADLLAMLRTYDPRCAPA